MGDAFPVWVEADGTPTPAMTMKRRRDVLLPLRTVKADNEALRVAAEGEVSCINGKSCTARVDIHGGPGVCLKAMLPSHRCILCLRRDMRARQIAVTVLQEPIIEEDLIQMWESPVGPGGYREDKCMKPGEQWNGFVSECALGLCSDYQWALDKRGWHINQDRLLHFRQAPTGFSAPVGASSVLSGCTQSSTACAGNTSYAANPSLMSSLNHFQPCHLGHPQRL